MEISLRSAVIISTIIHCVVFAPFYNQHMIKLELEKRNAIVVDYIVLKEMAQAIKTNKEAAVNIPDTSKIDIKSEITAKQDEADKKEAEQKRSVPPQELKDRDRTMGEDAVKAASREAALKSNKDYINYYQFIREKIRARLKNNYRYYKNEGDIYLSFTISPSGYLQAYNIDRQRSTGDEVLLHITIESLKAVSPFPAIPRTISQPRTSFSIIISFKK